MRPENCRSAVVSALRLLSSADMQLAYERDVPQISVTDELLSIWFDDTNLPDSPYFRQAFSKDELAALAAFSLYLDDKSEKLPGPRARIDAWLQNESWQEIMRLAGDLTSTLQR